VELKTKIEQAIGEIRGITPEITHRDVASKLNEMGIPSLSGDPWTRDAARNFYRRHMGETVNMEPAFTTFGNEVRPERYWDTKIVTIPETWITVSDHTVHPIHSPKPDRNPPIATHVVKDAGSVFIIPDTHEPFSIPGFPAWCREMADRWGCETVVHIGDLVDNYATSLHEKDPDTPGVQAEYEKTLERLQKWYDLFPDVILTLGNHDDRPVRTAKAGGISSIFVKSFRETWAIPNGWTICQEAQIDGVCYVHTGGSGGRNPSLATALDYLMPVVSGHYHTLAGVAYHHGRYKRLWGLDTGCGVDRYAYSMAYNRSSKGFALGAGVVVSDNGVQVPHFIPFG
jgi:hypothetical protein